MSLVLMGTNRVVVGGEEGGTNEACLRPDFAYHRRRIQHARLEKDLH